MDLSNLQPFLNMLGQNFTNQTPQQNINQNNFANTQNTNSQISSYYPQLNIDGTKISPSQSASNLNQTNIEQPTNNSQNQVSFPQLNLENLISLLGSLGLKQQENGANPLLGIMQNFLKPKKEKKTSENGFNIFLNKKNTENISSQSQKTSIENFKNVDDIDIDKNENN